MIDRENEIFSGIASTLRDNYSGITVVGEYIAEPAKFPHASIVEMDNYTPMQYVSTAEDETHAVVTYEINVYSNKANGKKAQAKAITKDIDDYFVGMGFRRISLTPVPNLQNASIYRLVARYTGVVTVSENTIYTV